MIPRQGHRSSNPEICPYGARRLNPSVARTTRCRWYGRLLPGAYAGVPLTMPMLFHVDLNLYAFVGIIMLVGIVKKNASMMIDFALEAQRSEGKGPLEAVYEGCLIRFR